MSRIEHMVIAVDGPAASGKGTLSKRLANHFGLARLDTGLLYRAVAVNILNEGGNLSDKIGIISAAKNISYHEFNQERLRSEEAGIAASKVAVLEA